VNAEKSKKRVKRVKGCIIGLHIAHSELRSITSCMGGFWIALLSAIGHRWTCPILTPAKQASTQFTRICFREMEGWVTVDL